MVNRKSTRDLRHFTTTNGMVYNNLSCHLLIDIALRNQRYECPMAFPGSAVVKYAIFYRHITPESTV